MSSNKASVLRLCVRSSACSPPSSPAVGCTLAASSGRAAAPSPAQAHAFAVSLARAGPRPAASGAERRAHQRVAARFRAAGLRVGFERFAVPGKGASRDVIAIRDVPAHCLVIAMAHADSVPPAPGADDNASGVGDDGRLARALGAGAGAGVRPLARGHRLRGAPLHRAARPPRGRGARAPPAPHEPPARRPLALALDEVGRGTRFELRSPVATAARASRDAILAAGPPRRRQRRWLRDSATGNSDHRELALAGAPAAKLGVPDEPCRHTACDTPDRLQRGAFARVLRVVWPLLREVS